ncbi:MAG: hypothetical protein ABI333_02630 [bacterium]
MRAATVTVSLVVSLVVSLLIGFVGLTACDGMKTGAQTEKACADLIDNDGDGLIDCADPDCADLANCVTPVCGDNIAEGSELCDGSDLTGTSCRDVGFRTGTLACDASCTAFDTSQCEEDGFCGNERIDVELGEECDRGYLGGATCERLGLGPGELNCDHCVLDTSQCGAPPLATCSATGPRLDGVTEDLSCALDTGGSIEWDLWSITVAADDCVDVHVDNGSGAADLLAYVLDASGMMYGVAHDFSQLDDEWDCSTPPWSGLGCPSASILAGASGELTIAVAQWDVVPEIGVCQTGPSAYTLYLAVNGVDATPLLVADDTDASP